MEEALLRDIHHKLAQLEHKVSAYRMGMAAEFKRYYHQAVLNAGAEPEVVSNLERSIAEHLSEYPALSLDFSSFALQNNPNQQAGINDISLDRKREQPGTRPKTQADSDLDFESDPPTDQVKRPGATASAVADSQLAWPSGSGLGSGLSWRTVADPDSAGSPGSSPEFQQELLSSQGLDQYQTPPSPGAVFGAAVAPGKRRAHDREKEFQGLFTPFFLPLLDSSPNSPASPPLAANTLSAEPVLAGTGSSTGSGVNVKSADHLQGSSQHLQGLDMEGSSETGARQHASQQPQPQQQQAASPPPSRPTHHRTSTDDTSSSTFSEQSDTKVRRSALRRSSSNSKPSQHSPRRVRFEFRGTEVLPTASPQPSDFPTPRPSSPVQADQPRTFDEIVGDNSANAEEPLGGDPPPRKISSSEALRALSRTPLEDDTVWTVVTSGSEEPGSEIVTQPSAPSKMSPKETKSPAVAAPSESARVRSLVGSENALQQPQSVEESDDSSDEDFLSIAKPKSFKNKKSGPSKDNAPTTSQDKVTLKPQPIPQPSDAEGNQHQPEDEKGHTSSEDFDEEDDMFHFETGGLSAPPKPKRKPTPRKDDASEPINEPSPEADEGPITVPYGTSPAVPISRPAPLAEQSTSSTAKFQVGSIGSYKGRPVMMPVVKNPEVHAEAASLGEFNTFVGGLDGRSGVDEGDLSSFRASLVPGGFSGTPKSLTERMLMEDAQAARGNGN